MLVSLMYGRFVSARWTRGDARRWGLMRRTDALRSKVKLYIRRDGPPAGDKFGPEIVFERDLRKRVLHKLRGGTYAGSLFCPCHEPGRYARTQRVVTAGEQTFGLGRRDNQAPPRGGGFIRFSFHGVFHVV